MSERLPLFPLSTVLFPGAILPLHVFETRYQRMIADLLDGSTGQRFCVVSIEAGHEVGDTTPRLASVGCAAQIRSVERFPDGRYQLTAVGTDRLLIDGVDRSGAYPRATVTPLPDEIGRVGDLPEIVSRLFRSYLARLAVLQAPVAFPDPPPVEPLPLCYAIAAAVQLPRQDKQRLLEAEHAAARLAALRTVLRREVAVLRRLPSLPAIDLLDRPIAPN